MPKVVVANGLHRTGSTLVYMLAQEIIRQNGQAFTHAGANLREVDALIANHKARGQGWLTIKSHRWMPMNDDPDVVAFYTTRNLADMARSFIGVKVRHGSSVGEQTAHTINEIIWQDFFSRYCAPRFPHMHVIKYEDWYGREAELGAHMAERMELPLPDPGAITRDYGVKAIQARADAMTVPAEDESQLRRQHVGPDEGRPSGSLEGLPPEVVDVLRRHL